MFTNINILELVKKLSLAMLLSVICNVVFENYVDVLTSDELAIELEDSEKESEEEFEKEIDDDLFFQDFLISDPVKIDETGMFIFEIFMESAFGEVVSPPPELS